MDANIWNEFELKEPPLITMPVKMTDFVEQLYQAFNEFLRSETTQQELAKAAALLSRLKARRKNSFRHFKVYKIICKLNAALCRLLRVDLSRVVQNFRSALPDLVMLLEKRTEVPPRPNFDYVLVRLLGVHHLHQRIHECCEAAAQQLLNLLRANYFVPIVTLLIAVLARLRASNAILSNRCSEFYVKILPHRLCLPANVKAALNMQLKQLQLPQRLATIQLDKCLEPQMQQMTQQQTVATAVSKSLEASKSKLLKSTPLVSKLKTDVDEGVVLNRETLQPKFSYAALQTAAEIEAFIKQESMARKQVFGSCLTKRILPSEWSGAVRIFGKKLAADQQKQAIYYFQRFLNNKI